MNFSPSARAAVTTATTEAPNLLGAQATDYRCTATAGSDASPLHVADRMTSSARVLTRHAPRVRFPFTVHPPTLNESAGAEGASRAKTAKGFLFCGNKAKKNPILQPISIVARQFGANLLRAAS